MTPLGNEAAREAFAAAMRAGAMHHGWLLAGPQGVGKGAFARMAALALLARAADPTLGPGLDVPEGHRTRALFAAGAHPDYRELVRLPRDKDKPEQGIVRSITIAQVRGLLPMFATKPALSGRRVVVIDAIDDLERSAANALLKNLEEPPQGTVFLLVSHAPGRLLPTIRSRCRLLRFEPLPDPLVAEVLRAELPEVSAAEIEALMRAGAGSPGRALGFAGLDLASIERDLEAVAEGGDASNAIRARLARTLGLKAAQPRYEAFLERAPSFVAEIARTRSGGRLREALDAQEAAQTLAAVARAQSLDASATVFEMAGLVARLAR